jgi:hypothetical protein
MLEQCSWQMVTLCYYAVLKTEAAFRIFVLHDRQTELMDGELILNRR